MSKLTPDEMIEREGRFDGWEDKERFMAFRSEMLDILKSELDVRDQDLKEFGLDINLENKIA